jgi:hypothetical protein
VLRDECARDLQIAAVKLRPTQERVIFTVPPPEGNDLFKNLSANANAYGASVPFREITYGVWIEWSNPVEGCTPDQHRAFMHTCAGLRHLLNVARRRNLVVEIGELHHMAEDGVELGVGLKRCALSCQLLLGPEIIAI